MHRIAIAAVVLAAVVTLRGAGEKNVDWPLHNLDLQNSRFSPLAQITSANAGKLALKWTFETSKAESIGSVTPLVIDGVMYFNSGSKLFAVDAVSGKSKWTFNTDPPFGGGRRGPAYGDGRIYATGQRDMYVVDAKTGKAVESFGDKGVLRVANKAMQFKYPGKYPVDVDPLRIGYSIASSPTYANGVVYLGLASAEMMVRGGIVVAMDGKTGAIRWVFNTVPQGPADDGWEIAKDTWGTGARVGGGIWTQPAIDEQLGLIYFNVSNPVPGYDGSPRHGINLFADSIVALRLDTGKLAWHFQTVHHNVFEYENVAGPALFDVTVKGVPVKALATVGKTCYAYMLNRETGAPINPIVETAMPTATDVPGEQIWPTQPIPYTARGVPQTPFCMTYPIVSDPQLAKRVRQMFTPYQAKEYILTAPGNTGGANWGSPSFSPRTGLLYATGKNDAHSLRVMPVGDSMAATPGPEMLQHPDVNGPRGEKGLTPNMGIGAYDPASGGLTWYSELPGLTGSGSLVTAGDVLFQAVDRSFFGLDARTGKQVFRHTGLASLGSSPMTYQVGKKQYVAVTSGNAVFVFGLR
ncbi:MAG: PQQ-binding-like beta-propeller repeat protein [Vicinamibacterales bacterium]